MTGTEWPEFGPQRHLIPELPKPGAQTTVDLHKQPSSPVEARSVPYPNPNPPPAQPPVRPWPELIQQPPIKPVPAKPARRRPPYVLIAIVLIIFSFVLGYSIANGRNTVTSANPTSATKGCVDAMATARVMNDAWIEFHGVAAAFATASFDHDTELIASLGAQGPALDERIRNSETNFNKASADCNDGR